ncbi:MAG TPA: hypothetical protein VN908_09175 [Gemmatimonadales bacterium]|nr:hypothetical protein [Gemmatimonadales bacterium]
MSRACFAALLFIQAVGGGAITLAHARDVVSAPAGIEATHDGRCAILHDELRCALCHYAGARVVIQQQLFTPAAHVARVQRFQTHPVVAVTTAVHLTAPARAPPLQLS